MVYDISAAHMIICFAAISIDVYLGVNWWSYLREAL